jgi:hypothetical protein
MNSEDLTAAQAKIIGTALFPGHNYIARLIKRMEKAGFPHDDPLYLKVAKVHDAMHELTVAVHYMACDNIGRGGLSAHHLPMKMKTDSVENDAVTSRTPTK